MKIAIYGLSTETEKHLPKLSIQYEIVGLLDSYRTEGEMFGYPIISFDYALKRGIEKIIVVARPGSCKAIAEIIGTKCKKAGVGLIDIHSRDLLAKREVKYSFKGMPGYKKDDLLKAIESHEVINFDLFETLVTREVLDVETLFELLEHQLLARNVVIDDFVAKRIEAEKRLSQGYAPSLEEIYEYIVADSRLSSSLAIWEFELDIKLIKPRADSIMLLQHAINLGKKVYITTDSYYNRQEIELILTECGIDGVSDVIISSQYNMRKQDGLYEKLLDVSSVKPDKVLHIGDDELADCDSALAWGIDVMRIYSGRELLELLGGLGLEEFTHSISDKLKMGMLVSRLLNSPFAFEREGFLELPSAYDIGYTICAPMINDFANWFGAEASKCGCNNIWFCARDGYVVQQVFKYYYPDTENAYLYTSRTAAIRAGIGNLADIKYVDDMKFSGELEENLRVRFGLDIQCEEKQTSLLEYETEIREKSQKQRDYVLKYISNLELKPGPIAFFDFVAKGTCQMFMQKLTENRLVGLYFLQNEPGVLTDRDVEIKPFYREEECYNNAIFDHYYILEIIMTSPEASVDEYDSDGKPVFAVETRTDADIRCILDAQRGILEYTQHYCEICPTTERKINKELDSAILNLVDEIIVTDDKFIKLTIEDPFFNRMTRLRGQIKFLSSSGTCD